MAAVIRSAVEQQVWNEFTSVGYCAFGCCRNPGCSDPRRSQMTCGMNPGSRICIVCFEFEFGCTHPNLRRRARG